jgi:hypothetical protein
LWHGWSGSAFAYHMNGPGFNPHHTKKKKKKKKIWYKVWKENITTNLSIGSWHFKCYLIQVKKNVKHFHIQQNIKNYFLKKTEQKQFIWRNKTLHAPRKLLLGKSTKFPFMLFNCLNEKEGTLKTLIHSWDEIQM